MRKLKRLLALALAMVMVLAMGGLSVFAEGADTKDVGDSEASITILNPEAGRSYQIYKIFDMTAKSSGESYQVAYEVNKDWEAFFFGTDPLGKGYLVTSDGTSENNSAKAGMNTLTHNGQTYYMNIGFSDGTSPSYTAKSDGSETNIAKFAQAAQKYAGESDGIQPVKTVTASSGTNESENVIQIDSNSNKLTVQLNGTNEGLGYYMIVPVGATGKEAGMGSMVSLTNSLPNKEVKIKATYPKISKEIVGADSTSGSSGISVNVGDYVQFELHGTVPDTTGFTSYTYSVVDELSSGLEFENKSYDANTASHGVSVTIAGDSTNGLEDLTLQSDGTEANLNVRYTVSLSSGEASSTTEGETSSTNQIRFDIHNLNSDGVQNNYVGRDITISYWAKLNSKALETDSENNSVRLHYSNDPSNPSGAGEGGKIGETPGNKVYIYDFDIDIKKIKSKAGSNEADVLLSDATFALYRAKSSGEATVYEYYQRDETNEEVKWIQLGENKKAADSSDITKITTDSSGNASFRGIAAGTYYLEETKAPAGYNLLAEPVKVEIKVTYDNTNEGSKGKITSAEIVLDDKENAEVDGKKTGTIKARGTNGDDTEYKTPDDAGSQGQIYGTATIPNATGVELPSTGGMGTTIFYILGSVLVLGAGVILVVRRRMSVG